MIVDHETIEEITKYAVEHQHMRTLRRVVSFW